MIDPDSRYARLVPRTYTAPDGTEIAYLPARKLPRAADLRAVTRVTVTASDRLDLIATRVMGDSAQWWQVADANEAMHPDELTEEPGTNLLIAMSRP